jgi:hypothetical protein
MRVERRATPFVVAPVDLDRGYAEVSNAPRAGPTGSAVYARLE